MFPCLECGAPAEPVGRMFGLNAVSFDGKDTVVWFEKRLCAAGHQYQVEVYEEDR